MIDQPPIRVPHVRHRLTWGYSLVLSLLLLPLAASAQRQAAAPTGQIAGQSIYTLTQQFLSVAPKRFNGSPGHLAAEAFIKDHFKPEAAKGNFETDEFTANTAVGPQSLRNYIVKYPGKKDGIIVLASHYETNWPLKDIPFVGANDGACTTALLIELGEYFRAHPPQGYSVYLAFFDGEEAVQTWSSTDSTYGSRHLAAKWSQDGTLPHIKAFLNADMIGDKNLDIDLDGNSNPHLLELLKVAAKNTGHANDIARDNTPIEDDTVPFAKRGVPVLDVIDYDYGPHDQAHPDGYHHTAEDTIDKISPQSLQASADIFLELIHLIDQH
jgi:Zn-dependent M28 family amino/carboxypeptidase